MKGRSSVNYCRKRLPKCKTGQLLIPPAATVLRPNLVTSQLAFYSNRKGLGRTSLQVVTGVGVASEWENILSSHHLIGVKVQTLFKTSLNVSLEHSILSSKMVHYGYLMFTTYLSEQFLAMLFCYIPLANFRHLLCCWVIQVFFSHQSHLIFSYNFFLYLSLNLSVLFA